MKNIAATAIKTRCSSHSRCSSSSTEMISTRVLITETQLAMNERMDSTTPPGGGAPAELPVGIILPAADNQPEHETNADRRANRIPRLLVNVGIRALGRILGSIYQIMLQVIEPRLRLTNRLLHLFG